MYFHTRILLIFATNGTPYTRLDYVIAEIFEGVHFG